MESSKYIKFIIGEGIIETLIRIIDVFLGVIYVNKQLNVYKKIVDSNENFYDIEQYNFDVKIKEVKDFDTEILLRTMYINKKDIINRISNGHRCFTASINSVMVGYLWVTDRDQHISEINKTYSIPAKSIYIYNVRTTKNYRNKGIFSNLLRFTCEKIKSENYKYIYTTILTDNLQSIKVFKKYGFTNIEIIKYKKILLNKQYTILKI